EGETWPDDDLPNDVALRCRLPWRRSSCGRPSPRASPQPRQRLPNLAHVLARSDLLREGERALIAPARVITIAEPLVDRPDELQTLDLAPPVAARGEVAEGGARLADGAHVIAIGIQGRRIVERHERGELGVFVRPRGLTCLHEELFGEL